MSCCSHRKSRGSSHPAAEVAFNETILPEYLANRYVAGKDTFYSGSASSCPGHLLEWSAEQGCRVRRYWHPPQDSVDLDIPLSEQAGQLRAGLERAVQSHLMSDVPLGLFLSGGLDSSGTRGLDGAPDAAAGENFRRWICGAGGQRVAVCAARRARHRRGASRGGGVGRSVHEALPKLIWHEDEPIAFQSSVPLFFVSRLARQHVKVVLTGEGADELFLGTTIATGSPP